MQARAAAGPTVQIFFHRAGVVFPDALTLILGFIHNLVTAFILAFLMLLLLPAAPTYWSSVRCAALVGVLSAVYAHLGNPTWTKHSWGYPLFAGGFDFLSFVIAGLALAYFITPEMAKR